MADQHIKIFDTTLRDGQQCPGAGMNLADNLTYARLAHELGVDVLEAGFPAASAVDFEIVNKICIELGGLAKAPVVAGLCQLREEQVIKTIEALSPAISYRKALLHTYVPVAPSLMEASLGSRAVDRKGIAKDVFQFVKIASDAGLEVQFSPEGYSRMAENFDFVTELIRAAIEAGANVINCPDTIGGACSLQGNDYIVKLINQHAVIISGEYPDRQITWSIHCHNDFGLAVQNSINAIFDGPVTQIEGCINGIGERSGNASLEQVVMIIKQFGGARNLGQNCYTRINHSKLQEVPDFVSKHMLPRQPHWPITGDNVAKHSSGGHINAILRDPLAYQPFDPGEIGKKVSFVFGPLSGSNHAKSIIESNGYKCDDDEKSNIARFIKDRYRDRRKGVTDDELMQAYFDYRQAVNVEGTQYLR